MPDLADFIILWDDGNPYLWCKKCRNDEPLPEPANLASVVDVATRHACDG